jgi:hypothetical protein
VKCGIMNDELGVSDAVHDQFLMDAALCYDNDDGPARRASARAALDRHPLLPRRSVWAAAATADHVALAEFLAADPSSARLPGGPRNWEPLLYLTYSRLHRRTDPADPAAVDDAERCLQLLLDAGADPNAGYLPEGVSTPFTALTGLFGGGEQQGAEQECATPPFNDENSPGRDAQQPAHPQARRLATLLLAAGADPNDAQTLYNRMFTPSDDHLELLFEHGLGAGDGGPWHRRDPHGPDTPQQMLRGQLAWAVTHGYTGRIALLARHGVDLRAPLDSGHLPVRTSRTPLQLAVAAGRRNSVDVLRQLGVDDQLDPATALIGALLDADTRTAAQIEADHPGVLAVVRGENPSLILRAAVIDRVDAIEALVAAGFDVDALGRADIVAEQPWETALHDAAGNGRLEIVRVLLRNGADREVRDRRFGATPLEWAQFFDQTAAVTLLA